MTFHLQLVGLDKPDGDGEQAAAFAARLGRVVEALRRPVVPRFDVLCVSGAFARPKGIFPVPEEQKIPHQGDMIFAVESLQKQLTEKPGELYHHLSSDVGILGRAASTAVIGDWAYRNVGATLPGVVRRCVASGAIEIGAEKATLPIHVVRMSRPSVNIAVRQAQLMSLISLVKERWDGAMLTPVVVGDFGFDAEQTSLWDMMLTDFDEVGNAYGAGGTEHIWLGRESSFRGATGTLGIEKIQRFHHFNDGGSQLTCHPAVDVEAYAKTFRPKRTFSASPRARSRGAPTLAGTAKGLYMAWSARQTSGQVTLARTENGVAWDGPHASPGHTNVGPALASFGDRMFLAWTEPDKTLWMSSTPDGAFDFDAKIKITGATTEDGPALVAFRDRLLLFWTDKQSDSVHVSESSDGKQWSAPRKLPFYSEHAPGAAVFRDRVYLAWTEKDDPNYVSMVASPDGTSWNAPKTTLGSRPRARSAKGPTLLSSGDRLFLAWIGPRQPNGYAWFSGMYMHLLDDYYRDYLQQFLHWTSTSNGVDWAMTRTLDERSEHPPALAHWDGRIQVAWTGVDADNCVNIKVSEQPII